MRDVTSVNRTGQATERVEEILAATPGVASVSSVVGFSFLDGLAKSSSAFAIVVLDPFAARTDPSLSAGSIIARLRGEFRSIVSANGLAFNPSSEDSRGGTDVDRWCDTRGAQVK